MLVTIIPEVDSYESATFSSESAESDSLSQFTGEISGSMVLEPSEPIPTVEGTEAESPPIDVQETSGASVIRVPRPLIRLEGSSIPKERIKVLQQWEGVVTEVTSDSFFADLQDLSASGNPIEVVEISVYEISIDERSMIVEGAVFYWSIGYETTAGGQLRRTSEIRMRRSAPWSKRAIRHIHERGRELFERYGH